MPTSMFICANCAVDTLTRPHKHYCPFYETEPAHQRQTREKWAELNYQRVEVPPRYEERKQ